jgi:hypothetical protein
VTGQVRADVEQRSRRMHDGIAYQRGLAGGHCRQHEGTSIDACSEDHRQRTADRTQLAGQAELACEFVTIERRLRKLAAGGEHAERDGQVEAAGLLRQVGGREAHRHLARGKLVLRVLQRSAHAVARLAHLGFREADEMERGQAAGEMHFDRHARSAGARERARMHDRDGHRGVR